MRKNYSKSNFQENYAFIDAQNLYLGVISQGWKVDYKKFRLYLKNKFNVTRAYLFIGFRHDNQAVYSFLQQAGYILIFKPTVQYLKNGKTTIKGNVDAELVLYAAAIEFKKYQKAVLVTGDGDFACLAQFLIEHDKLQKILVPNGTYSKLLKSYSNFIVRVDELRHSLKK